MNPLFITLEGIEGSGKSTNIKVINNYLNDKNINYINTREPGGSEVGDQLRNILLNTEKNYLIKLSCCLCSQIGLIILKL